MNIETMQELLFKSFRKHSQEIAIRCGSRVITYRELNSITDMLACRLIEIGMKYETLAGIFMEDRIELIIIMIAMLKAGCAFVPLDPTYPINRLRIMLEITQLEYIFADALTYAGLKEICKNNDLRKVILTKELIDGNNGSVQSDLGKVKYGPDDLIYIYFTSGTTGKPKAVMGRNKGLAHFIDWEINEFNITAGCNVSQLTSPSHDPFLRDVFTAICAGGAVCIPENKDTLLNPEALANWIDRTDINLMHCTPSLFKVLNTAPLSQERFKNLKYVLLAGERVIPYELSRWYGVFGDRIQLVNLYGPTETTLAKLYYLIQPEDIYLKAVPIGKPIKGAKAIVLDLNMNICDQNDVGEIYIRTAYRSLGYLNDPESTSAKFIPNPFSNNADDVIYKTGDLGRMLPNGNIEFVGRIDRQIKLRGYRIELDEIESELAKYKGIQTCAVSVRNRKDDNTEGNDTNNEEFGEEYITAYFVSDSKLDTEDIRNHLSNYLPEYAIPAYFVQLDALPMTANGKLNYKALPSPMKYLRNNYIAPRNVLEEKLAHIWCDILGIEQVGINEDFFHIGGHSLKVMSLVSMIYQEFEVEIPLGEIFDNPTIESIACYIARDKGLSSSDKFKSHDLIEAKALPANIGDDEKTGWLDIIGLDYENEACIEGIEPFNDIFYINCLFSAFFPIVEHYGRSILPFLANYTMLYDFDDNKKGIKFDIQYIAANKLENIIEKQGINVKHKAYSEDIISDVIKAISNNKPVIIEIDCYYESIRFDMYMKNHWPHYLLIYGYDLSKKEFLIVEHDNVNSLTYRKRRISFEDIKKSYYGYFANFPKTEMTTTFYEFSNEVFKENIMASDAREYLSDYMKSYIDNIDEIKSNLENIKKFKEEFSRIVMTEASLSDHVDSLLFKLGNIINAKYAEEYKYIRFINDTDGCAAILSDISKNWRFIRSIIEKYKYTSVYRPTSFKSCIQRIEKIYSLENSFYDRLLCAVK